MNRITPNQPVQVLTRNMLAVLAVFVSIAAPAQAEKVFHHQLNVQLDPASHTFQVEDVISVPASFVEGKNEIRFQLHDGLQPGLAHREYELRDFGLVDKSEPNLQNAGSPAIRQYAVFPLRLVPVEQASQIPQQRRWPDPLKIRLRYGGTIHHPLQSEGEEYARSFSGTPGIIDEQGVFLAGSSYWLPNFDDQLAGFSMTVTLPTDWDAVSQGKRTRHEIVDGKRVVTWDSPEPMDEIYLVAARFAEYSRQAGSVTAYAFLRQPDPNLAAKYLEATAQYLEMYSKLLGPYPYPKFALVENFWESGYGMPSFTLLGSQIIRFPFILHSSYPHEILHNWWGNSVFVDYRTGNWCEGLTAYLADHLSKEGQAQGYLYRRDVLQKYVNFVKSEKDFPLRDFRVRHSSATEAVGYGKSLMLWHMLRMRLGDDKFVDGLRALYRKHRFKRASFDDIRKVFSETSGQDLSAFFQQWVDHAGAPELQLSGTRTEETEGGYRASLQLQQTQDGRTYALSIPAAFAVEGQEQAVVRTLEMSEREQTFDVDLPGRPLAVEIDPQFDLFRRLHRREIPSSLGQIFGADKLAIVVPENDPVPSSEWRKLAETWARGQEDRVSIASEAEMSEIPADSAVWILGVSNILAHSVEMELEDFPAAVSDQSVTFPEAEAPRTGYSFVFTAAHPVNPDLAIGWIGADLAAAVPGLARKLPHYGKYSYLGFEGAEPTNVVKGQWSAVGSPLAGPLTDAEGIAAFPSLPKREPLAKLAPVFDPEKLMAHVRVLTAPEMEGRGVGTPGLEKAANYIAAQFEAVGLKPGGDDGSYFQTWQVTSEDGREITLRNVLGVIPGTRREWAGQSAVLGAHYDHLGYGWPDYRAGQQGKVHPGADDNASGVAVLIETARLLVQQLEPRRTLVFAAFSGEEWNLRGSRHYVESMSQWPASKAIAMINLDSVGRLGDRKLTVLGTASADEWVHIVRGIGFTTGVEATSVADDLGGSDQKSFLAAGVPAVQLFAGAHEDYHWPSDTADKIDPDGMVKTAVFSREAMAYLSERDGPLTSRVKVGRPGEPAPNVDAAPSGGRRVSLGTLPDFAYPGPGVKLSSVISGSPAEEAGLRADDVVVSIDEAEVPNLRVYASILRRLEPGDTIQIRVRRGQEELTLQATVKAR